MSKVGWLVSFTMQRVRNRCVKIQNIIITIYTISKNSLLLYLELLNYNSNWVKLFYCLQLMFSYELIMYKNHIIYNKNKTSYIERLHTRGGMFGVEEIDPKYQ